MLTDYYMIGQHYVSNVVVLHHRVCISTIAHFDALMAQVV